MRLFYDHLILDLDEVYAEVEQLEIQPRERRELVGLIDETTHHTVLDTILNHLDKAHHEKFLHRFHQAPHDPEHLQYLREKVDDIEEKINDAIHDLKQILLQELIS